MALIVEDGTGRADAEALCSVAFADAHHKARGNEAAWVDLDRDVKEQLLRKATDHLQQMYRLRWAGSRTYSAQALDWPRYDVWMRDLDTYLSSNTVPVPVQQACAELALRAKSSGLAPDIEPRKTRETVGPITVEYDTSAPAHTRFRAVDALLAPYLSAQGGIRIVRA